MSTDYTKLENSIRKYKPKSMKGIEKWNRLTPRVSGSDPEHPRTLKIEGESYKLKVQRARGEAYIGLRNYLFAAFMTALTTFAIGEAGLSYLWLIAIFPAWIFLFAGFFFLAALFSKSARTDVHKPLHLAMIKNGKWRTWREDPEQAMEGKRGDLTINVVLPGYTRPYGLGSVSIGGDAESGPDSLTENDGRFSYYSDLPEQDVKAVMAFKYKNGIKGDQESAGLTKVYQDVAKGQRALVLAAQKGDVEKVGQLLEVGFEVDIFPTQWDPALIAAAREGHVEVVELLLKNGADPDIRAKNGMTALSYFKQEHDNQKTKQVEDIIRTYRR